MAQETAPTPPPPPGEIGLHEAAQQIEAKLFAPPKRKSASPAPVAAEPADEAETYADSVDETPPATGADEEPEQDADGAAEEAPADEEDTEDGESGSTLYPVKVDGKEQKVTLEELKSGYQRQADYTRKTQALANDRKAFEAEAQHVGEERKQYAFLLTELAKQLPEAQEPDWVTYEAKYGTATALKAKLHWEQQERRRAAIQSEQQRLQQIQSAEQVKAHEQFMHQAASYLVENVPEWKDAARYEADRVRLRHAGLKMGYTEDELSAVIDPRAVLMLRKAAAFDDLVAKKLVPKPPSAETTPPVARPGVPQTTLSRKTTELQRAKKRLAETGRVEDAAKVFERLLR